MKRKPKFFDLFSSYRGVFFLVLAIKALQWLLFLSSEYILEPLGVADWIIFTLPLQVSMSASLLLAMTAAVIPLKVWFFLIPAIALLWAYLAIKRHWLQYLIAFAALLYVLNIISVVVNIKYVMEPINFF